MAKKRLAAMAPGKAGTRPSGYESDDPDQTPGDTAGLDTKGNPLLDRFLSKSEKALLKLGPAQIGVDWRDGVRKPVISSSQRRAAYTQQVGILAPTGHACSHCARGLGPFESCKVAITNGQIHFSGGCGGCAWGGDAKRCSLRAGPLPAHIYTPLLALNPDNFELARGCADDTTREGDKAVSKRGTPLKKRSAPNSAGPGSVRKRARGGDTKVTKKATAGGVPQGPEYDVDLFVSVLRFAAVLKKRWADIRSLREDLERVRKRAAWESDVLKKILIKNGEWEDLDEDDEEEDDMDVFEGLDL